MRNILFQVYMEDLAQLLITLGKKSSNHLEDFDNTRSPLSLISSLILITLDLVVDLSQIYYKRDVNFIDFLTLTIDSNVFINSRKRNTSR